MSVLPWSVGLVEHVKLASTALPVFVRLATPEKTVKVRRVAWVLRPKCNKIVFNTHKLQVHKSPVYHETHPSSNLWLINDMNVHVLQRKGTV